ncbi:MAG: hypothetical protein QG645_529, partial [Patescibacteria group bacterium]|nr:hypothetical protein [Patescibacteria group bacterium]
VRAVVMNVTAVDPTSTGHARIWPSDTAMPNASSLNFTAKQNVANSVTVPVGKDGKVKLYNSAGSTQYLMDVAGYYVDYESGDNVIDLFADYNNNFGKLHQYNPIEFSATQIPQNDIWNLQYSTNILLDNLNYASYFIYYSSLSKKLDFYVDGTNFSYCEPANCKILSNKIKALDNLASMNLDLKQNNPYKITFNYAKDKLGMPNGWITVNLVDPSSTVASEPLFATKIAGNNQNASILSESHNQRITKTIKDDIGYSCDKVDPLTVSIPRVLSARSGAIGNSNCPGIVSAKIISNSTLINLGLPKSQRDSIKPIANISKNNEAYITVSGSDNIALSNARIKIEPIGNGSAIATSSYPGEGIDLPLNMSKPKFEENIIFTPDMQMQKGFTYQATLYLYDTSGNMQDKTFKFIY